ncbi:MAG: hypothetical protein GF417_09045 [Candidatus Latescibacteria bacterium]|nr:hypothetical protein [bacterium]MBD3424569.1 hypothetical protein [Candidatus Latescibacterota bacterium]
MKINTCRLNIPVSDSRISKERISMKATQPIIKDAMVIINFQDSVFRPPGRKDSTVAKIRNSISVQIPLPDGPIDIWLVNPPINAEKLREI